MAPRSSPFSAFAATADAVAATRSKLAKRDILAAYLRGLPAADLPRAATFLSGKPLPGAADRLGLGWVQQAAALAAASGAAEEAMSAAWLRHSDFGDAAADLLAAQRPAGPALTVGDVADGYRAMADAPTTEARVAVMTELFRRATPDEARYVARIAARETRIGLREGLLEEAIAAAFDAPQASVRRALMLLGEPGEAATLARRGQLDTAALHLGRPIRPMLATPVGDAAEVMRRVGDEAWIEDKYDGIRAQLHLAGGSARLFSRDLKEITVSFPEVVTSVAALRSDLVLDGELIPFKAGAVLDFAALQRRLGRVNPDAALAGPGPGRARRLRPASHRRDATCWRRPSASDARRWRRSTCPARPMDGSCTPAWIGPRARTRWMPCSTPLASGATRGSWSRTRHRSTSRAVVGLAG